MNRGRVAPVPILLIGSGGLVGRHVLVQARAAGHQVTTVDVPWADPRASVLALTTAVGEFVAGGPERDRWAVVWAAGAGVVATPEADLWTELEVYTETVRALGAANRGGRGTFVLMSSAGGVYAGSSDPPFTEKTVPQPLVSYGRVKVAMEQVAIEVLAPAEVSVLILRLSNVYGPGQRLDKPQGLISQICRSLHTGDPLPVMVSHDTLRDYVFAPDVARLAVAALQRRSADASRAPVIKIVAAGAPVSVGQLIGHTRRLMRRPLRTVQVRGRSSGQVADLRFRSQVWADLDLLLDTPLPVGIAATARSVLGQHAIADPGRR